jgi:PKD repeat protein
MSSKQFISSFLMSLLIISILPICAIGEVPGNNSTVQNVTVLKINDFNATVVSGTCPLHTNFRSNVSGNVTEWNWTFEPTGRDYYSKHAVTAVHTFKCAGIYNITLKVYDSKTGQSDTMTKIGYITVNKKECVTPTKPVTQNCPSSSVTTTTNPTEEPTLVFSSDKVTGKAPCKIYFTEKVTGSPTKWVWNFGDGITSSSGNGAGHTYTKAGIYTVTVKVTNAAGTTTVVAKDLIRIS